MTLYRCVDCQRYVDVASPGEDATCSVCGGLVVAALEQSAEPGWLDAYRRDMERTVADRARRKRGGVWRSLFGRSRTS